jgi:hypothetical protein
VYSPGCKWCISLFRVAYHTATVTMAAVPVIAVIFVGRSSSVYGTEVPNSPPELLVESLSHTELVGVCLFLLTAIKCCSQLSYHCFV